MPKRSPSTGPKGVTFHRIERGSSVTACGRPTPPKAPATDNVGYTVGSPTCPECMAALAAPPLIRGGPVQKFGEFDQALMRRDATAGFPRMEETANDLRFLGRQLAEHARDLVESENIFDEQCVLLLLGLRMKDLELIRRKVERRVEARELGKQDEAPGEGDGDEHR